jgi:hypothetical protein
MKLDRKNIVSHKKKTTRKMTLSAQNNRLLFELRRIRYTEQRKADIASLPAPELTQYSRVLRNTDESFKEWLKSVKRRLPPRFVREPTLFLRKSSAAATVCSRAEQAEDRLASVSTSVPAPTPAPEPLPTTGGNGSDGGSALTDQAVIPPDQTPLFPIESAYTVPYRHPRVSVFCSECRRPLATDQAGRCQFIDGSFVYWHAAC